MFTWESVQEYGGPYRQTFDTSFYVCPTFSPSLHPPHHPVSGPSPGPVSHGHPGPGKTELPGQQPHPLSPGGRRHPRVLRRGDQAEEPPREADLPGVSGKLRSDHLPVTPIACLEMGLSCSLSVCVCVCVCVCPSDSGLKIPVVCVVLDGGPGTLNVSHPSSVSLSVSIAFSLSLLRIWNGSNSIAECWYRRLNNMIAWISFSTGYQADTKLWQRDKVGQGSQTGESDGW